MAKIAWVLIALALSGSGAAGQGPTDVQLAWTGKEVQIAKGQPLYAELFVFDAQKNTVSVADGPEFRIVGGYPVPVRMTSIGPGFGGTISAVYQDVVFSLGGVPAANRVIDLGVVAVNKDLRYDVRLVGTGEASLFVDKTHVVYPGASRNIAEGGPFATLAVKVERAANDQAKPIPVGGVSVTVKTPSGGIFSSKTDPRGEARVLLRGLTGRICSLTATGTSLSPSPLPLPVVGAREGLVEYQVNLRAQ
jgi:hypothetical protein